MPDLPKAFDQEDIDKAKIRCEHLPEGWDYDRFVEWLNLPSTIQKMVNAKGPDWTLADALNLLSAPALSNTERARLGMRKVQKRNLDDGLTVKGKKRKTRGVFEEEFESTHRSAEYTDSEAIDRIVDGKGEQELEKQSATTDDADSIAPPKIDKDWLEKETTRRLTEVLAGQTDVQPNDVTTAKRMVQAEALATKYYEFLAEFTGKPAWITALNLAIEKQHRIARECQILLGIDRAKRQADAAKSSDVDKVLEIHQAGSEFVKSRCVPAIHCNTLVGYLLPLFRKRPASAKFICPAYKADGEQCLTEFEVVYVPTPEDIAAETEPDWVKIEEGTFKPDDEITGEQSE